VAAHREHRGGRSLRGVSLSRVCLRPAPGLDPSARRCRRPERGALFGIAHAPRAAVGWSSYFRPGCSPQCTFIDAISSRWRSRARRSISWGLPLREPQIVASGMSDAVHIRDASCSIWPAQHGHRAERVRSVLPPSCTRQRSATRCTRGPHVNVIECPARYCVPSAP